MGMIANPLVGVPDSSGGPSAYNSIMGNTVGFLWRAATGTVDPWTKANIVAGGSADGAQAAGPNATPQQKASAAQATVDAIDNTLISLGADPSQAAVGLRNSIEKSLIYIAIVIVIFLGVYGYAVGRGARQ